MLFHVSITIPANTEEKSPTIEEVTIARGIISKFMVRPRPGHAGLAHCIILHHNHQIAPSTVGMSFSGDTHPIDWEDYYECYEPPFTLEVRGWNSDDSYEHTFDIYVAILPRRGILATAVSDVLRSIFGLFGGKTVSME